MKKLLVGLMLLFVAVASFGQATTGAPYSKEYYLQKSKSQKKAAWALLIGGTTLIVAGAATSDIVDFGGSDNSDNDFWGPGDTDENTADFLILGGIAADLTSILFFRNSARNARKAASISFNEQKILVPQHNTFIVRRQPSITVKIGL